MSVINKILGFNGFVEIYLIVTDAAMNIDLPTLNMQEICHETLAAWISIAMIA